MSRAKTLNWKFLRPCVWEARLIDYFHIYGDVTIAGEGLQNLGLWSALRAFKQGGIFIVPHLL
jgi:hypothetical protein